MKRMIGIMKQQLEALGKKQGNFVIFTMDFQKVKKIDRINIINTR